MGRKIHLLILIQLFQKKNNHMEDSIMAGNPDSNGSRYIKFTLLVIFGIVSMICACYIFYHIIKFPLIRQRFHNQTLIFLIILVSLNTAFNIPTTFRFFLSSLLSP
jgi:hypothetical protein